jgi:hypothetical protein
MCSFCSNASEQSGEHPGHHSASIKPQRSIRGQVDGMVKPTTPRPPPRRPEQAAKTLVGQQSETYKKGRNRGDAKALSIEEGLKPTRLVLRCGHFGFGRDAWHGDPGDANRLMPSENHTRQTKATMPSKQVKRFTSTLRSTNA